MLDVRQRGAKDEVSAARSAMAEGDWVEAAARWRQALHAAPGTTPWVHALARTLLRSKDWLWAAQELEAIVSEDPDDGFLAISLARARIMAAKLKLNTLDESVVSSLERHYALSGELDSKLDIIELLIKVGDLQLARSQVPSLLADLKTARQCERIFNVTALTLPPIRLGEVSERLLERVVALLTASPSDHHLIELQLKLLLRIDPFGKFATRFEELSALPVTGSFLHRLKKISQRLTSPAAQIRAETKVFGVGLSKTGTTSLSAALDRLGVDNGHWTNPFTGLLLSDIDFYMLGGATDTPVSVRFEQLARTYPNAKFILTERPVESWRTSFSTHMLGAAHMIEGDRPQLERRYGPAAATIDFALYLGHSTPEAAYSAHTESVLRFFAGQPRRLLRFDVSSGDGWPKLCDFLRLPVPNEPFPARNRRSQAESASA